MNVQIAIFEIEREAQSFPLDRRKQRRVHIEIDGVAKLVGLARALGFHAGSQICRIVTAERTLSQTPQQVPERFVAEKVQAFFSHLEFDIASQRFAYLSRTTTHLISCLFRLF